MKNLIKHFSCNDPTDLMLEALNDDAGIIIDDVMSDEQLLNIKMELDPFLKRTPSGQDNFTGFKTQRVGALIARSKTSRDLALHPMINEMAEKFLEHHCDNYQLHFTSAINIGPGETPQILHRDRGVWGGYVPRKIETQFSAIWAITDFTFENGATQIVPGSHKWDKDREPKLRFSIFIPFMRTRNNLCGTIFKSKICNCPYRTELSLNFSWNISAPYPSIPVQNLWRFSRANINCRGEMKLIIVAMMLKKFFSHFIDHWMKS